MTTPIITVPAELILRLKQLWNAGLSATECAAELGIVGDPAMVREAILRAHQTPAQARTASKPNHDSFWTDERTAELTRRHRDGESAAYIYAEMGAPSRSAVLGKIHRLGLPTTRPVITACAPTPRSNLLPRLQTAAKKEEVADPMFASDGFDGSPDAFDLAIPVEQRRSLLGAPHSIYKERAPNECGFPIGDPRRPDFFFCGAKTGEGKHYCAHHCRRAFAGYRRAA